MKKIIMILLGLLILIPGTVLAETQAKDLKETVESIDLTMKNENYSETSDQVTVYLFRWNSCEHCHDAVEYFNELAVTLGDKFKLRSFETSQNIDNRNLQTRVVKFLNIKDSKGNLAAGVPIIIIGESTFYGFNDSFKSNIQKAIEGLYKESDRYDVFEAMEKDDGKKVDTAAILMVGFAIVVIAGAAVLILKKK